MPDYQFNTNLGPAQQQGTSLGDLVNTARGVQSYQQAQQLNPIELEKAQTELQKSKFGLSKEQALHHAQVFGFLANNKAILEAEADPQNEKKRQAALAEVDKAVPVLKALGANDQNLSPLLGHLKSVPASEYPNIFAQMRNAGMSASAQNEAMMGAETASGKDIYGNPLVTAQNRVTGQVYQKPLPFVGQPAAMRFAPGESAGTLESMMTEREAAKQAAGAVAPALNNVDTILANLKLAQTGKYSDAISGLQSAFGNLAGSTAEEKAAAARDIIQKNIADLGLQKNAALGGKFVASLQTAQESLADAGKNPTAIAKSMEQLRPLLQHAKYYQQGLEKTIQKNGGDVQVKRKFDNEMIDAFDPKALMVYNAYKAGDTKALSRLSPDERKEVLEKITKYNKLVNGDL